MVGGTDVCPEYWSKSDRGGRISTPQLKREYSLVAIPEACIRVQGQGDPD